MKLKYSISILTQRNLAKKFFYKTYLKNILQGIRMIRNIVYVLIGLCMTASTITISIDNPLKPPLEILKATGLGQKELGYSNDIPHLIRHGNNLAFISALAIKYRYNPFSNKDNLFKNLGIANTVLAAKDFSHYYLVVQQTNESLHSEHLKQESSNQKMINEGSTQTIASIIGLLLLKVVPMPKACKALAITLALYTTITGAKKVSDGYLYKNYLQSRIERNKDIERTLSNASEQLIKSSLEVANETVQNVFEHISNFDLPDEVKKADEKIK